MSRKHNALCSSLLPVLLLCGAGIVHAEVTISGVEAPVADNIRAYLRLDDEPCDAPEWRIRSLFDDSDSLVRDAMKVLGYYDARVEKTLEVGGACWQAKFAVTPGRPVKLRDVTIRIDSGGQPDSALQRIAAECDLHPGDVLRHDRYESCKRRISVSARDRGYFSGAYIANRIDVYPHEHAADIALEYVSGPRYDFGSITFEQEVLDSAPIQRYVTIRSGEPYDAGRVRQMQRHLVASDYFDQVLLTRTPRDAPFFDVPIHIELTPGKKYQYNAGIGFSTDIGPKLSFGILNRRFNDKGHQALFDAHLSGVVSDVGVTYRIPLDRPKDWYDLETNYIKEDNDSFVSDLLITGVQRSEEGDNNWLRTLFLNLRFEKYSTSGSEDERSRLLTPGLSYAFVEEDYPPRPVSGHRSLVKTQGGVDGLVSDTSFLQLYGQTKWAFGLWNGGRLLARAEAGFTLIDNLDTLPASVRYFAGGDTSVRGYGYKSLGPQDALGNVVGGENLLVGSVEVDQEIADDWSLAAFIDSGNAYDDYADFETATAAGIGIRWYSPIGPVRFDVAFPLDDDAPDDFRIHITLGPDL